jgi:cytochrome c oxidase subunit 4
VAEHKHDAGHAASEHQGEHHGMSRYIVVWLTLLVLTVVTVVTGKMDLGAANIWVAMAIAITKATLVVLFFMHLWDTGGVNRLVFVVSVIFVGVLILGVFGDLLTRLPITLPHGGPVPFTGATVPPPAGH